MTTINDVAIRAGVSTATVSRTLSAPEIVSAETRQKVTDAIQALGYVPNYAAQSLRTLRSGKIVVTVPDIANPFFSRIIQGVGEAAKAAGHAVLLGDARHDPEQEEQYAEMLLRKEADGLIFLGHRLPVSLEKMIAVLGARAPVVNGCEFSPALGVSSVHIDNAAAAAAVMALLLDLGHRRIGVITGPLISPLSRDRLDGARSGATKDGETAELLVTTGDFSIESGEQQAHLLLARAGAPTAIFCFSDEMAIGAMAAARSLGLGCPLDVSIIGFDDIRFARYVTPALTTIRQPSIEIGRSAVHLLLSILAGEITEPLSITLPHELIVRKSTGRAKTLP